MSRKDLESGDFALLGRLNRAPRELGSLPAKSVTRLAALGLVHKVLGFCEITRAGQLEWCRDQYRRVPRRRVARVTRRSPLFLQETRLRGLAGASQLRTFDAALREFAGSRWWVARMSNFKSRNTTN